MLATATTTSTPLSGLAWTPDLAILKNGVLNGSIFWPQPSYVNVTIRNEQSGQTIYVELYKTADSTYSLPIAYQAERTITISSIEDLNIVASASSAFKYIVQQT